MEKRDFYFDNAKFILIFFVVFGHLLQSYISSDTVVAALYKLIYMFHMPAFILVSGYFAKGIYEKGYVAKLARKLILPYVIFQIIYSVFYYFLNNESAYSVSLLNPYWSLWFLISLFCWNIMLLFFSKLPAKVSLSLAIAAGLLIGYADFITNTLSLSRTFVFFPFFLAGFYLERKHFTAIASAKSKWLAGFIMLAVAAGLWLYPDLNEKWLLGSKPYSKLDGDTLFGLFRRLAVYLVNYLMIYSFFAFVPKRRYFFTQWGRNTLYVYLLHGFIVRAFRGSQLESYLNDQGTIFILFAATFLLTALLSSKATTAVAQPVIELKMSRWKQAFQFRDPTRLS